MEVGPLETSMYFSWQDYTVFATMLVVSAAIGVYFGFIKKQKKDADKAAEEFLIGGGKMKTFPVALSMLAGFLSSITLIGQPAEVYLFGPQIWMLGISCFIIVPVVSYICVPFFRNLNATSAYEYFGRRFSKEFQLFASTIFSVNIVLFLALVLYAPALALHQVTGINTNVVVTAMYVVCIFYTTVGGIRAVIWTDTFQILVLYTAMLAVLVKGTMDIGGLGVVYSRNANHNRDNFFNFDLDPTVRYSVWSSFIGGACLHLFIFGGNQLQIQRFLSVSSNKEARKMVWIYAVGWSVVASLTAYAGMLIFARYSDCDPLTSGKIKTADQLFPLYVMDVLGSYKGFPGLFVAGIFSAGLSTVSTGVNSLAAIWFAGLDGTKFKKSLSSSKADVIVKLLALFFGLLSFAVVFLVPYMGALVPIAISLNGFFSGALAGIFVLGVYVPFANSWGAFLGLTSGLSTVAWLTIGSQIAASNGFAIFDIIPLSTMGCSANVTTILTKPAAPAPYRLSFMWYSVIAFILTVSVGVIVSFIVRYVKSMNPKKVWSNQLQMNRHVKPVLSPDTEYKIQN